MSYGSKMAVSMWLGYLYGDIHIDCLRLTLLISRHRYKVCDVPSNIRLYELPKLNNPDIPTYYSVSHLLSTARPTDRPKPNKAYPSKIKIPMVSPRSHRRDNPVQ